MTAEFEKTCRALDEKHPDLVGMQEVALRIAQERFEIGEISAACIGAHTAIGLFGGKTWLCLDLVDESNQSVFHAPVAIVTESDGRFEARFIADDLPLKCLLSENVPRV